MQSLRFFLAALFLSAVFLSCSESGKDALTFEKLLCNYTDKPIAVDSKNPQFSWVVASAQRGQLQTAYQIVLSQSINSINEKDLLWDSKKIATNQTTNVTYAGAPLQSNTTYYWRVSVWDLHGDKYDSPIHEFHTAFLSNSDWKADWIVANNALEPKPEKGFFMDQVEEKRLHDTVSHQGRSVMLRNEFILNKDIKNAKLFITGLGFYEVMINGKRVGNKVLAPAKTPYHKYILYNVYDVTDQLTKGNNAIGIHLGNGWYNPYKNWWKEYRMQWFGYKKALAQLHITFSDGSEQIITTNDQWKTTHGPLLFNCIYDGEVYDANEEQSGWADPDFDDSSWKQVSIMNPPQAELVSESMPAMEVIETRIPVKESEPKAGMKVYDLGQNFTGWIRLTVDGNKGDKVRIKFSEELNEDGTLDFTCNEHAKATVEYILKGGGSETYETTFSYFGFQFVEITSEGNLPEIIKLEGQVVHSANKLVGDFECSHDLINKMHHAAVWSQKSNMLGYPMDCPQRDERLGWLGDAQVTAEEAMYNFDMALFYKNFFRGLRDNQDEKTGDIPIISPRPYIRDDGVEWSSSFITMVWDFYRYYGDEEVLKENYTAMSRYMDFLYNISEDYIVPQGWIGDWGSMVEGWQEGEPESVPTAYYFYNATILQKIARRLGKDQDAMAYEELAEKIRSVYNELYFNPETNNYNDGSQMANAFPLYLGLVDEDRKPKVLENLIVDIVEKNDTHLTTGVLGTKYLIEALSMSGRSDISWSLATQTTYPSWAEMMKRFNTMCEFWTLKQSHNHVMMGSIDAWFYKSLAGIQLTEHKPAYEEFIIKPHIAEGLNFAKASTETIKGIIKSSWEKSTSGFNMNVEIPFNCSALVYIPSEEHTDIFENDMKIEGSSGLDFVGFEKGYKIYRVSSGNYNFSY